MNKQFERYLKASLIILDLVVLNLVYYFCQIGFNRSYSEQFLKSYNLYFLISNGLWLLIGFLLGLYRERVILNFAVYSKRTFQVYLLWVMLMMFYLFFSRELLISRLFIFYSNLFFALGILFNRFIYLGLQQYFKASESLIKRVMILGYNDTAIKLTKYLESDGQNTKILGYTENDENIYELTNYPIIGDISSTLRIATELHAQEIFSTITPEKNEQIYDLMQNAEKNCIKFKVVPDLHSFFAHDAHIEFYGTIPVLSRRSSALDDMGNIIKKRLLDIAVSSMVILLVLSWMIPLLGLLIVIESGFPVFFRQLRTGMTNKLFWCIKFRSMKENKLADTLQATQDDARVTRIGRFMRRTSLDEFPQFINVFLGNMSLVGPRPHMMKHTNDYSKIVDEYMVRQFVKPGITGWAQIHGLRGEVKDEKDIRERVEKDLWYIENWTLWLDVQILFLTVYYILKGDKNAY